MATIPQQRLFSWKTVESSSDLDRLRMVFSAIPDEDLMQAMEAARGKGRDDYPVRVMWNSVLAGIVLGHPHIESLRRELRRNGELRDLCGFDPLMGSDGIPGAWVYSRFLHELSGHQEMIDGMFHSLVEMVREVLPDFGKVLAVDSKALESFGNPTSKAPGDGRRDTDAQWGRKEYSGRRGDGTVWNKVVKWFGYKLHLLVDSQHELPVAYEVTGAAASDMTNLLPLVKKAVERHPGFLEQCEELSGDRGYDSIDNNEKLYSEYFIKPLIDIRNMWKEKEGEDGTRSLYPDRADNIVYDYQGNVFCVCPVSGEKRNLAYCGYEEKRGGLKYRCPAAHYDYECKGRGHCHPSGSEYGRVVRIPLETDRRIFTPIARSSESWAEKYKKRTAVERVNSRLDVSFGFEVHTIRGLAKMKLRVGLAMVVMLAMAVGSIKANQAYRMRSLVWSVKEPKRRAA